MTPLLFVVAFTAWIITVEVHIKSNMVDGESTFTVIFWDKYIRLVDRYNLPYFSLRELGFKMTNLWDIWSVGMQS